MSRSRSLALWTAALAVMAASSSSFAGSKIEAVPGKDYRLTKQHGPWMITVASLRNRPEAERSEGKTAQEAAADLVYELRTRGIPAYVFEMEKTSQELGGGGGGSRRINAGGQISVIAGNYGAIDSEFAVKTLAWLKAYHPKCLSDESGAAWKPTPGRPGPLSGAFLTVNPLLSADEVASMARRTPEGRKNIEQRRKLLANLNASNRWPLSQANGTFSMRIAGFTGKSVTNVGQGRQSLALFQKFDDSLGDDMDAAGRDAFALCATLRNQGVDAYLWHDRYESIVTVGTFNAPNDPRIAKYRERFAFGYKTDDSGNRTPDYKVIEIRNAGADGSGVRLFALELDPQLVAVPSLDR